MLISKHYFRPLLSTSNKVKIRSVAPNTHDSVCYPFCPVPLALHAASPVTGVLALFRVFFLSFTLHQFGELKKSFDPLKYFLLLNNKILVFMKTPLHVPCSNKMRSQRFLPSWQDLWSMPVHLFLFSAQILSPSSFAESH